MSTSLDYSHVVAAGVADGLVGQGKLVKVLLMPRELGGQENANNVAYLPPKARGTLDEVNTELVSLYGDGHIDQVAFSPEYKGKSLVPAKIFIFATHSERSGNYMYTLDVW